MAIYKSGKRWYGKVICDGVTHKLPMSYTNKRDAEEAVKKLKATLKSKKAEDRLSSLESIVDDVRQEAADYDLYANSKILDIWEPYLSLGHVDLKTKSPSTIKVYHGFLKSLDTYAKTLSRGALRLKDVTPEIVSGYLGWLRDRQVGQQRIACIVWVLKRMWKDLSVVSTHRVFKKSPWDIYTPTSRPVTHRQAFTRDQIKAIWHVLDNPQNAHQQKSYPLLKLLCVAARRTGLRKIDLCHLKWESIHLEEDLSRRLIILTPVKTKASGKEVTIPIADDLFEMLKQQHVLTGDEEYVCREWVRWYSHGYIEVLFRRLLAQAGIDPLRKIDGKNRGVLTFHSWRHTAISELAEVGVGEQTIRAIVQHSSIDIHRAYTHVRDEAKAQAIRKLMSSDQTKAEPKMKDFLRVSSQVWWTVRRRGLDADKLLREILRLKGILT